MEIRTKFNIGDVVCYDGGKIGTIVGCEIYSKRGIFYELDSDNIKEKVELINHGNLRNENEITTNN